MNGTFHKVSLPACAAIGALLAASSSWAAGFALRDQSASGLGTAFAGGTAGATDDASGIFFNPAVIGLLPGSEVSASATFIAPQSKLHDGRAARAAALGGSTISGPSSTGDAAEDALVPAGYGVWAASPDLRFGLAVTSPWGLVTEYDDNWIGRYHGIHSELLTVNVNPVVAYRLAPRLTVAGGVQVQYATADLSQAVDVGGILAAMGLGTVPGSMDAQARIEGSDWGVGFTAGVIAEPLPGTRVGLSYRSAVQHTLDGDSTFTNTPAGPLGAAFADGGAKADLTTPDVVSLGLYQKLTDKWAVVADVSWTNWSRFNELRVRFDAPGRTDSVTVEDWDDAWFAALGAIYQLDESWTLRAGVAFDQSPVPEATRTPRIPDQDRTWIALGAGYKINDALRVDGAYTHIFVKDAALNLADNLTGPDRFRGNLSGAYDSQIDIVSLQVRYAF